MIFPPEFDGKMRHDASRQLYSDVKHKNLLVGLYGAIPAGLRAVAGCSAAVVFSMFTIWDDDDIRAKQIAANDTDNYWHHPSAKVSS